MSKQQSPAAFYPNLPGQPPEVQQAFRLAFSAVQQHEQAFAALKAQVDANTQSAGSTTVSQAVLAAIQSAVTNALESQPDGALGGVNKQSSSYTITDGDNGGMVVFTGSAAATLSLSGSVRTTWVGAVQNLASAALTLQPASGSTVNGQGSLVLQPNQGAWIFFDSTNWWALLSGQWPQGEPTFAGATTTTTATAGSGTVLPTAPAGYITVNINGTDCKVPYYQP